MKAYALPYFLLLTSSVWSAAVVITDGILNEIQTVIGANPAGTDYVLELGIYPIDSVGGPITLKVGDTLTGQGPGDSIVTTSDSALVDMFDVSANDITISSFTVLDILAYGSGSRATNFSVGAGVTGLTITDMQIIYGTEGIDSSTSQMTITNNTFESTVNVATTDYAIDLGGTSGDTVISGNTIRAGTNFGGTGTIFVALRDTPFTGSLTLSDNTMVGSNVLEQFYHQSVFSGAAGSFAFTASGNTFTADEGSLRFT